MNILYLIGNGFDLAQGLKTKYTDFYPYYIGRTVYNPAVKKMLERGWWTLIMDELASRMESYQLDILS